MMDFFLISLYVLVGFCLGKLNKDPNKTELLPSVAVIQSMDLSPGSILVIKCSQKINSEVAKWLRETALSVLPPGVKVMVINEFTDIYAVLKDCSLDVTESNKHADDSKERNGLRTII